MDRHDKLGTYHIREQQRFRQMLAQMCHLTRAFASCIHKAWKYMYMSIIFMLTTRTLVLK